MNEQSCSFRFQEANKSWVRILSAKLEIVIVVFPPPLSLQPHFSGLDCSMTVQLKNPEFKIVAGSNLSETPTEKKSCFSEHVHIKLMIEPVKEKRCDRKARKQQKLDGHVIPGSSSTVTT